MTDLALMSSLEEFLTILGGAGLAVLGLLGAGLEGVDNRGMVKHCTETV